MNIILILGSVLALLVVAGLALYAWRAWRQVWRQQDENSARHSDARTDQIRSLRTLAKSLLSEELNASEAAIRIKVMLDHLRPDGSGEGAYPAIYGLYDKTEHMPRGPARDRIDRHELARLDAQREQLELEFRESLRVEAQALLDAYPPH